MASNGAYAIWPMTAGLDSGQASENITGPYDIAAYEREVYAVVTNKAPMGPYRGVGRVIACFSIERTMDEIAARLGLEPLEVRRRNVIREYPHTTPAGLTFESGSSAESLDLMEELLDVPAFRARQREERLRRTYLGLGVAAIVEHTALGPQEVARKGITMVLGLETASLRLEPDGAATLIVGSHSQGQGHQTTYAQIVADQLGVPFERISVRYGDTAAIPYGLGTWASRSLVYAGGATILATESIIEKGRSIAAHLIECNPADLDFRNSAFAVRGTPERAVELAEVAHVANHRPDLLPESIEPGLEATRWYRAPDPGTFSNSLHAAIVEVDIETGEIAIERYVVIEDCGTIVNPTLVEGQLHGGIAQGLGQALLENAYYDDDGQPLAVSLMDYLVPGFTDVPRIEVHHIETPSPHSLGGFKGMGEGGAINPPAVMANAVTDALAPFGIAINQTPITPGLILAEISRARDQNDSISREVTR
jgi:carbon-monoxide dehydrogenase large subunit